MKLHIALFAASFLLNAATWIIGWFWFPRQSPTAILHTTPDVGIDFVGAGTDIMTLPFIGSLLLILNYSVGLGLKRLDERLLWLLVSPLPLMQLTLLSALLMLWYVNR